MKVVGLLPTLDEHAFGPGMYRAADDDIVNVTRGGVILTPMAEDSMTAPRFEAVLRARTESSLVSWCPHRTGARPLARLDQIGSLLASGGNA